MSQNLLLEYDGGTPQQALTGQYQRGWFNPDSDEIEASTGALSKKPDYIETMVRSRMLSKQCILQGLIQQRLARASYMKQYKHSPELLLPGSEVDIWRAPDRKDEDGWRGPAELLSLERIAGSAIVRYQGQPLLVPLRQIRKHILTPFFVHSIRHADPDDYAESCNPQLVIMTADLYYVEDVYAVARDPQPRLLLELMDIVDGMPPGKVIWVGIVWKEEHYAYEPDKATVEGHKALQLCRQIFMDKFPSSHGIIYGTDLRRIPRVEKSRWSMLLRWQPRNRVKYSITLRKSDAKTFPGTEHTGYSTIVLYSFDHAEEFEDMKPNETIDMSDLTEIPFFPDTDDDDDLPSPIKPTKPGPPAPPDPPEAPSLQPAGSVGGPPHWPPDPPAPPPPEAPDLHPAGSVGGPPTVPHDHNNDDDMDDGNDRRNNDD